MKQKKTALIITAVSLIAVLAAVVFVLFFLNRSEPAVSSETILKDCPFELSDNADWKFYPSDNLAGLAALARDHDDTDQTFVLVFSHSPEQKEADNVIINGDLIFQCFYDSIDFNDQEIVECGNLYYMKMKCDKRITVVSFVFNLENGDIREVVSVEVLGYDSVPKMNLRYSRFDYSLPPKTDNIRKTQIFNEETGNWEEIADIAETTDDDDYSEYVTWTELQVDEEANELYVTRGGITVGVCSYNYTYATYDVYQEPKDPQVTTIRFLIATDSDAGVESIEEFDINNISTDEIRLYVKEGSEYVDITPGDFYLETASSNEKRIGDSDVWVETCRFINLNSNELGELGEHEYRLVIMDYTIDFTLRVQTFEAW
ncbi:hypothetical protein [Butyrivibrio sp. AE2032]|uniref:hypothetical protein n=1 Tax=Butyrivibrio sp. AE2032 TaxID=1458463 RepID=UPI00054F38B1|nr:hypothetical protein [Butyrivibrio sp. AE2032]